MSLDFLNPVHELAVAHAMLQPPATLGQTIRIHTEQDGMPDLQNVDLVIIGLLENRKDNNALIQVKTLDHIRRKLYELYPGNWTSTIADLGDVFPGETVEDTYFVVRQLTEFFLLRKIIPIYIGGSQDLMYPMYRAFDEHYTMINALNVDCRFDLGDINAPITSRNYVGKMVTEQPYNLFNYTNLGFQTYFNSQDEIELLQRMYFEADRLGALDQDITLAEPHMRDADLVGIDLQSVRSGDLAFAKANPNGFNGKQICSLSRYAGISDRLKVFGVFETVLEAIDTPAQLVAEIVWYFIEGYNYRSGEYPLNIDDNVLKYQVPVEDEILIFYKSSNTGRWWIEIPFIQGVNNKLKQHTLLPCSYQDYQEACNQHLPDKWLRARKKNEF